MTGRALDSGGSDMVAELRQSRNASAAEALAMFRAQLSDFKQRLAALRIYRIAYQACCVIIPAAFFVLFASPQLGWTPSLPPVATFLLAAVLFLIASQGLERVEHSAIAQLSRDGYKADRRFRLEQDAVVISEPSGTLTRVPWSTITGITLRKDLLILSVAPLSSICLPMAAHEGQDVEGFCAELRRRWGQNNASARPEPAP